LAKHARYQLRIFGGGCGDACTWQRLGSHAECRGTGPKGLAALATIASRFVLPASEKMAGTNNASYRLMGHGQGPTAGAWGTSWPACCWLAAGWLLAGCWRGGARPDGAGGCKGQLFHSKGS